MQFPGLFANSHMPYHQVVRDGGYDVPTLANMTKAAIRTLKGPKGFFLLVFVVIYL